MQFVQAFEALGYSIENQRQDWSAEKLDGVCLSLWSKETDWKLLMMDTRLHGSEPSLWQHKPGNKKRLRHACRALDDFDGWIDVVKIDGVPGEGYGSASPWRPSDRKGLKWRIVDLDEVTGDLRLEAQYWHSFTVIPD
jgi:hypothetical protein